MTGAVSPPSKTVTDRFIAAVGRRDLDAILACFTEDASYGNVPHPPAVGRAAIGQLLAPLLERSQRVDWEIVSCAYAERCAWLERVDRFWIDGVEYSVQCNGVYVLDDERDLICQVRDYVDLAPWRERISSIGEH